MSVRVSGFKRQLPRDERRGAGDEPGWESASLEGLLRRPAEGGLLAIA